MALEIPYILLALDDNPDLVAALHEIQDTDTARDFLAATLKTRSIDLDQASEIFGDNVHLITILTALGVTIDEDHSLSFSGSIKVILDDFIQMLNNLPDEETDENRDCKGIDIDAIANVFNDIQEDEEEAEKQDDIPAPWFMS